MEKRPGNLFVVGRIDITSPQCYVWTYMAGGLAENTIRVPGQSILLYIKSYWKNCIMQEWDYGTNSYVDIAEKLLTDVYLLNEQLIQVNEWDKLVIYKLEEE